jgi:hypothetical protein
MDEGEEQYAQLPIFQAGADSTNQKPQWKVEDACIGTIINEAVATWTFVLSSMQAMITMINTGR